MKVRSVLAMLLLSSVNQCCSDQGLGVVKRINQVMKIYAKC